MAAAHRFTVFSIYVPFDPSQCRVCIYSVIPYHHHHQYCVNLSVITIFLAMSGILPLYILHCLSLVHTYIHISKKNFNNNVLNYTE